MSKGIIVNDCENSVSKRSNIKKTNVIRFLLVKLFSYIHNKHMLFI